MRLNSFKRFIVVILLIVISALIYKGVGIFREKMLLNSEKKIEIQNLKDEIAEETEADDKKDDTSDDTNEEYEALARKELGLIKKDEIVIRPR